MQRCRITHPDSGIRRRSRTGIKVSNVSKCYGADAFQQGRGHNCTFTIERGEAHSDDRPVGLRQEHADPAARRIRAAEQRHDQN